MHDIRLIRDNPAAFDAALARRGHGPVADAITAMDSLLRELQTDLQGAQARRNEVSKGIGAAMGKGDTAAAEAMKAEVAAIKDRMVALEAAERDARTALQHTMAALPNLPADDVPDGADESANVELGRWGAPRNFDFAPREQTIAARRRIVGDRLRLFLSLKRSSLVESQVVCPHPPRGGSLGNAIPAVRGGAAQIFHIVDHGDQDGAAARFGISIAC